MTLAPPRSRRRPLAILLAVLVGVAGLVLPGASAAAAPGDIAGATLQWGVKTSFRTYITTGFAHGQVSATGVDTATPYGWSGGAGSQSAGSVAYPGSLQFQGHQGFGVPEDEFALDLTFSDVTVRITGATTAELVVDARSRGLADPSAFVELDDVVLATLDLAAGTDVSTAGTIAWSGVPATLTEAGVPAFAGFYPAGTALDPVSFSWPVEQAPIPVAPAVTVSQTTGLHAGDVVTVTGTGFGPSAGGPVGTRPPLAGEFAGVYVTFGSFLDVWRPSEAAPSSARKAAPGATRWVVDADDVESIGGAAAGAVAISEDGSFNVEITVTDEFVGELADGNFGIYTYAGSGAVHAPFETFTPIAFADPAPTISVSDTTELEAGDVVTVTGTGFGPDGAGGPLGTRPPLAGKFAGVYVTFGTFLDVWRPSESAPSSSRKSAPGTTRWIVDAADLATVGGTAAGGVAIGEDGSFSVEITVTDDFAGKLAEGNIGIYTYAGSGAVHAPFETFTRVVFASPPGPGTEPPAQQHPQTAGALTWGVKASFRAYVTGPIAHGAISTTGASTVGGAFVFPQTGAPIDPETTTGGIAYGGSVRFTGHAGALDLRLGDPIVRVDSPASATLLVRVDGGTHLPFATLALAAGSRTASGGLVNYANVPATLTAQGAAAFDGFYAAGTALDPVSFSIGAAGSVTAGTRTIAAFVAPFVREPDATPPATTGITLDGGATEGGAFTATAAGFEPGESGILVVIYSDPVVLADDVTADAAGTVTWTGRFPAGLTGEHTLTFQGSVDRGIVVRIAESVPAGCPVESATLDWGFKESFRAYIDGSIADGEWTVADGASYETPSFSWITTKGGFEGAGAGSDGTAADLAFTGSVRFTGHGGVLDTTIADPALVIDGDRAVLLLDVTGTTQDGQPVVAVAIEFAELDLTGVEFSGEAGPIVLADIPARLTAAGAAAFGTYEAGTELDPVTVTIDPGADCLEPVVEEAAAEIDPVGASDTGPAGWIIVALAAIVAIGIIVGIVLVVRRRRLG